MHFEYFINNPIAEHCPLLIGYFLIPIFVETLHKNVL